MLNALKFVHVTVSGWLAPGARSPRGLPTPHTWSHMNALPHMASHGHLWPCHGSSTMGPSPEAASAAASHAARICCCYRLPRPALRYHRIHHCCLALRSCHYRRIVVASVPVRCNRCTALRRWPSLMPRARGRAAIAMSFMTLRPRGPRRSGASAPVG